MIANVLPTIETPTYLFRCHFPVRTSFHGSISLCDITRHGSQESDAVLGSSNSVGRGSIDNKASKFSSSLQIDIVDAHPSPTDDLQAAFGGFEDLAVDFGTAPDDQGIAGGDFGTEVFRREVVAAVNVGEGSEEVEAGISKFLGDKDGGL
ncbi:hypothetical protein Hanom_Chr07g00579891 [Helianthus anomalus]